MFVFFQTYLWNPLESQKKRGLTTHSYVTALGTDPNWYMKLNDTYSLRLVTNTKYDVFVHINTDNDSSISMGYLRIKNAVPEDSGTYQCIQGTSSFDVLLEIYSG